ncbi:CDP-alcohol phosphatidyltransferase family protein [Mahella australiensis]|uniref:CDP-diacylglycerol--glycerol-3-phosphate 3-phosphatidyltransferase n=1 Tax=Mahella australiensis (strain DSM 15567 / CIP 107919 / 50-1 BON) TaxID=697281 RepID=F4A038_MAHA5|nr:CDP-alcohol phosphatidyltransferase family protein [Mahella australiensis]AEE96872.1 CDP-alcohol phosphatidyltransferase [Mahella australiensis 50-1 BON]
MTLPNVLTTFRLGLVGVFLYTFYGLDNNNILYSFLVFTLAELSDVLDGYIARHYNMISDLGKILDPIADKAMLLAMLFALSSVGLIPWIVFIIVLVREGITALGAYILYKNKKVVAYSRWYGKAAAVIFYIAIVAVVFDVPYASVVLTIAVMLNVASLVKYLYDYYKLI